MEHVLQYKLRYLDTGCSQFIAMRFFSLFLPQGGPVRWCSRCRTIAGTLRRSWITDAREAVGEARYGRAHKILTATGLRKKRKRKRQAWRLHALEKGFMCGAGGGEVCQRKGPRFCSAVTTQLATVKLSKAADAVRTFVQCGPNTPRYHHHNHQHKQPACKACLFGHTRAAADRGSVSQ